MKYWNRRPVIISLIVLLISLIIVLILLPDFISTDTFAFTSKMIQARNSLITKFGSAGAFEWKPGNEPSYYLLENPDAIPESFRILVDKITYGEGASFAKSLKLAHHLSDGHERKRMKSSSTIASYRGIRLGYGSCSDYTQVFNGLCNAASIPVREWQIWDRNFRDGHSLSEIYDSKCGKWTFIDSFYSFWVSQDEDGIPLSFLEFRKLLLGNKVEYVINPIDIRAYKAMTENHSIISYYKDRVRISQLVLGNNVFGYDNYRWTKWAQKYSVSIAQAGNIILGRHPHYMVLDDGVSTAKQRILMLRRKVLLFTFFSVVLLFSLIFAVCYVVVLKRIQKGLSASV